MSGGVFGDIGYFIKGKDKFFISGVFVNMLFIF